ncbi:MAG: hypothetical protein ACLFQJ_05495 [Campylobacterales bacterium]
MNLKAFKNKLFHTVFICVRFQQRACSVDVLYTKNSQIVSSEHKKFKSYDITIPMDAIQFIRKIESKYKIVYTSTIVESITQSIAYECVSEGIYEEDEYMKVCLGKGFGAITRKSDIDESRKLFEKIGGLDFLYSPYVVLWKSIESIVDEEKRLYLLNLESSITIAVGSKDGLEYGAFFHMISDDLQKIEDIPEEEPTDDEEEPEEEMHEEDESLEEEGAMDDSLEDLDELSNLESLEDDEDSSELGSFDESHTQEKKPEPPKEDDKDEEKEQNPEDSFEEFARGVDIISYAKESIEDYYKNPNLDSAFIDTIVIMDSAGLKEETIEYMKDSLLLEIKKDDIDAGRLINELSFAEVRDEI